MWSDLRDRLDDDARDRLDAMMATRTLPANDVLFWEGDVGDAMYVIDIGHILVERVTENGDTVAVAVLGSDSIVGEQALLNADSRAATARALTKTTVRSLSRDAFTDLRRRHAVFDELLVDLLDGRIRELNDLVMEARHTPADERVRRRIAEMHLVFGDNIPITQATLGALAGTTRPTTNTALRKMEEAGVVELRRGRIVVKDPSALR
jgi:CRP-like cAMP-binding protein